MKQILLYSYFVVLGLIILSTSHVFEPGFHQESRVENHRLSKNFNSSRFNFVNHCCSDFTHESGQTEISEIPKNNEQERFKTGFEFKLNFVRNIIRSQFFCSGIEYLFQMSFNQINGYYLYFLCKILI